MGFELNHNSILEQQTQAGTEAPIERRDHLQQLGIYLLKTSRWVMVFLNFCCYRKINTIHAVG